MPISKYTKEHVQFIHKYYHIRDIFKDIYIEEDLNTYAKDGRLSLFLYVMNSRQSVPRYANR